mmetsp:Transcript_29540/g.33635  ORF Transcript_29540/g.33635 Transcript_29540/m.33635 type:complete len:81 (+) Transcript_29540:31-273(+)
MLGLKDFIRKAKVRALYRELLSQTKPISDAAVKQEMRTTIRREFDINRDIDDAFKVEFLLSDGRKRIKEIEEIVKMASGY